MQQFVKGRKNTAMENNIFVQLMDKEITSGAGCGEWKAFGLATATARKYAPGEIRHICVEGSPLLVIGVQTILIPHTGGKRGGMLSTAMGAICGDPSLGLGVLNTVTEADVKAAEELVATGKISINMDSTAPDVYLKTVMETDQHTVTVIISGAYNSIKYVELDGKALIDVREDQKNDLDCSSLSVDSIYDYCKNCDLSELDRFNNLIKLTREISKDGLDNPYGMQVGRTLQENIEKGFIAKDEVEHILMWTVSGIDARMNGSCHASVGNTGSASQGHIICAAPIAAGEYRGCSEEEIIRAVTMSNLLNIYMDYLTKEYAHLSPMCYCGSVGVAAAIGGVAYLHDFTKKQITDLLRSVLGTLPGIICDGASKPICALRVYTGMSGALQAMLIVEKGISIQGYEGIVNDSLEVTLDNIYRLQKECMSNVNDFVFKIKTEQGNLR